MPCSAGSFIFSHGDAYEQPERLHSANYWQVSARSTDAIAHSDEPEPSGSPEYGPGVARPGARWRARGHAVYSSMGTAVHGLPDERRGARLVGGLDDRDRSASHGPVESRSWYQQRDDKPTPRGDHRACAHECVAPPRMGALGWCRMAGADLMTAKHSCERPDSESGTRRNGGEHNTCAPQRTGPHWLGPVGWSWVDGRLLREAFSERDRPVILADGVARAGPARRAGGRRMDGVGVDRLTPQLSVSAVPPRRTTLPGVRAKRIMEGAIERERMMKTARSWQHE